MFALPCRGCLSVLLLPAFLCDATLILEPICDTLIAPNQTRYHFTSIVGRIQTTWEVSNLHSDSVSEFFSFLLGGVRVHFIQLSQLLGLSS